MADEARADDEAPKKSSKKPVLFGLLLALVLGGGGFFAAYAGLLGSESGSEETPEEAREPIEAASFVPIEPLVISIGGAGRHHLKFAAELEVAPGEEEAVAGLMPRILDVMNTYLRALSLEDFERDGALVNLRAQMLRRVQLVVGEGHVRDLLVTEFVTN
ncbi:flagellar basal body-associated protein FliL [Tropicimonas sp. IMCC34011]|uniref:flagellar basal body-associated FliL family protein n=1 Tax=Tropicimonas sp. IMCC34011 TaxID=2248759 RepID=UPI000E27A107|nr:flagellar basal body-associated FliL family protein [Tropicimonas sp. IMCC34011]